MPRTIADMPTAQSNSWPPAGKHLCLCLGAEIGTVIPAEMLGEAEEIDVIVVIEAGAPLPGCGDGLGVGLEGGKEGF